MNMQPDSIVTGDISERIKKVEKFCRKKFPDSYVNFIKKCNVGVPIDNEFLCNNHYYAIDRFLGFVNDFRTSSLGWYDIAVVLTQLTGRLTDNPKLIGEEMIPIVELFAGDCVCLDYRKNKEEPSVCVWDHEASEEFSPVTYHVADTFSEFIAMLR